MIVPGQKARKGQSRMLAQRPWSWPLTRGPSLGCTLTASVRGPQRHQHLGTPGPRESEHRVGHAAMLWEPPFNHAENVCRAGWEPGHRATPASPGTSVGGIGST